MQVGPHDRAVYLLGGVEEMMVVVPKDANIDETQDITQEDRQERGQRRQVGALRHLQIQHHDRDDDGDDSITESLEPIFGHGGKYRARR